MDNTSEALKCHVFAAPQQPTFWGGDQKTVDPSNLKYQNKLHLARPRKLQSTQESHMKWRLSAMFCTRKAMPSTFPQRIFATFLQQLLQRCFWLFIIIFDDFVAKSCANSWAIERAPCRVNVATLMSTLKPKLRLPKL